MTIQEAEARVEKIKGLVSDPEAAHGEEDDLWRDVLNTIVQNDGGPSAALAEIALKTRNIEFTRWYA